MFSTVSSGINAMSCVTIEDFIKPFTKLSERKYTWISKGKQWKGRNIRVVGLSIFFFFSIHLFFYKNNFIRTRGSFLLKI